MSSGPDTTINHFSQITLQVPLIDRDKNTRHFKRQTFPPVFTGLRKDWLFISTASIPDACSHDGFEPFRCFADAS